MRSLPLACLILAAIENDVIPTAHAHSHLTRHTAVPIAKRHAPFESVRTRLRKDRSGVRGDPVEKYFHESTFHAHYDGRFADTTLPRGERYIALTYLVQTYLATMASLGAETWIMHGSLLGWWWNRATMPWDTDIDVQMNMGSMSFLAAFHNMTVHHFQLPQRARTGDDGGDGRDGFRDYLLEVNPNYKNSSVKDRLNVIDARWIDMETGLFIDITTVRPNITAREEGLLGRWMCKDAHQYLNQDLFPLRTSTFHNIPVKIPYAYSGLLEEEYGEAALTQTSFTGHVFDQKKIRWVFEHAAGWEENDEYEEDEEDEGDEGDDEDEGDDGDEGDDEDEGDEENEED